MKKLLAISLTLSLIISSNLSSQNKSELSLGYGILSGTEIGVSIDEGIGLAIGTVIGLGVGDIVSILIGGVPTNVTVVSIEQKGKSLGTFSVGYSKNISKRWAIGGQMNYNHFEIGHRVNYSNGSSSVHDSRNYDFLAPAARLSFSYIVKPKF